MHCPLPPGNEAVHCRSCGVHCPQAVRQCIAGVALPTAPKQWGSALQEFHCPVPPGSEVVHCRSCSVHCPQGNEAVRCRSCTAHCPQAVRQCIAGVALPTAPKQWGSALQGFHCPLPPGSEAVHCSSSTAHCYGTVRQCIAGVALSTAVLSSGMILALGVRGLRFDSRIHPITGDLAPV